MTHRYPWKLLNINASLDVCWNLPQRPGKLWVHRWRLGSRHCRITRSTIKSVLTLDRCNLQTAAHHCHVIFQDPCRSIRKTKVTSAQAPGDGHELPAVVAHSVIATTNDNHKQTVWSTLIYRGQPVRAKRLASLSEADAQFQDPCTLVLT